MSAAAFLARLAPDVATTFQTYDDRAERSSLARILHGDLDRHLWRLNDLNATDAGVFVMVNCGDGRGRRAENVISIRALVLDLDGPPLAPVTACPVHPDIIVESSPGRFHCYWLVSGCALDRFGVLQKALAAKFNGDPVVVDRCRVMRLPGFYHRKAEPFLTRIIYLREGPPHHVDDLVARLDLSLSVPEPPPQQQPTKARASARPLKLDNATPVYFRSALDRAAQAIKTAAKGRQNYTLNREAFSIGQLVAAKAIPESTARRVLFDAAAGMFNHDPNRPWTAVQITRMVDRCFAQAASKPRRVA